MPTYQYQCSKGHAFEIVQRISDKAKSKCPECGAKAIRIISGGAGLIFKGTGFYITDYGKDGKGPRTDPAATDGAAPAKNETAPAPAPAPAAGTGKTNASESPKPSKKAPKAAE